MTALLEVSDLRVSYGKVEAVRGLSLTLTAGTIVTIVGPNGAGKSTTLNAIMGMLPYQGAVRFGGGAIDRLSTEFRVGQGLCLVPERRELFATMSVEDNLRLGAYARYRRGERDFKDSLEAVFARFPRLKERRQQLAATLSGGERQMLALARALMARPTLIMLDEPSLGLAPRIARDIFRIVAELRSTGVSILLVEQNARAALQVSDYAYVLEMGKITAEGPSRDLAKDRRVIESYLGLGGSRRDATAESDVAAGH